LPAPLPPTMATSWAGSTTSDTSLSSDRPSRVLRVSPFAWIRNPEPSASKSSTAGADGVPFRLGAIRDIVAAM
jgi:hypothetical protein